MKEEFEDQGFDITVTHRDPVTGLVVRQDPYTLIVTGDTHHRLWERPKNSGNVFDRKGRPNGRWVRDGKGGGVHKPHDEHVEVAPQLSSAEKANQEIHVRDNKIAELEKQLIELERKQAAPRQVKPKAATKADEV